jgi:F-type H+-transporting ATPase subunit gamma
MPNLQEVRNRIASVSSTQQITSAMKMVSAAKFRRAQSAIIGMRPYANQLSEIISDIDVGDGVLTPYHETRKVERVLLVVVTSNKGLCGAFNSNIIKSANARVEEYHRQGVSVNIISLGKRGSETFRKQKELLLGSYDEMLDNTSFDVISSLAEQVMQDFVAKKYDRVEIIYNQFKNSLVQILSNEQFLPIVPKGTEVKKSAAKDSSASVSSGSKSAKVAMCNDYIYEPNKEEILRQMIPLTLRSQFYRIVLDSLASENGARMNAMQKATDNATELLKELRLSYNKARQAAITNEIIEIVSGANALNG